MLATKLKLVIIASTLMFLGWNTGQYFFDSRPYHVHNEKTVLDKSKECDFQIRITNTSNTPIKIRGAATSCRCVEAVGLPMQIEPNADGNVRIRFRGLSPTDSKSSVILTFFVDESLGFVHTIHFSNFESE